MNTNPGIKTTEFWLTAAASLFAILAPALNIPITSEQQAALLGAVATVYTIVRGVVKIKSAK